MIRARSTGESRQKLARTGPIIPDGLRLFTDTSESTVGAIEIRNLLAKISSSC